MLLIDVFINIQHAEFHFVFTAAVFTVFTPETSLCTRAFITALHFLPNRSASSSGKVKPQQISQLFWSKKNSTCFSPQLTDWSASSHWWWKREPSRSGGSAQTLLHTTPTHPHHCSPRFPAAGSPDRGVEERGEAWWVRWRGERGRLSVADSHQVGGLVGMGEGGRQVAGKRATAPNSLPGIEQAAAPTSRAQVSYWAHACTHTCPSCTLAV